MTTCLVGEMGELGGADLGRAAAEAAVEGQEALGISRERLLVDTARGYKCPRRSTAIVLRSVGAEGCRGRSRY